MPYFRVKIDSINKLNPTIKYIFCKPSLKNTKRKEAYTRVLPVSFWSKISREGISIKRTAMSWSLNVPMDVWISLKCFDMASAVANFANSLGCMVIPPIAYHDKAPLTFFPKIKFQLKD